MFAVHFTGCETAAGVASESHHCVSGTHSELGSGERCCELLQPYLPLTQTMPQPLRECDHSQRGRKGNYDTVTCLRYKCYLPIFFKCCLFFFSWCMKPIPRKKPRASTRFLTLFHVINSSMNSWANFFFFILGCFV